MQPEADQLAAAVQNFIDAERRLNELADGAAKLAEARSDVEGAKRSLDGATAEVHYARGDVAGAAEKLAQLATEISTLARTMSHTASQLTADDEVHDAVGSLRHWVVASCVLSAVAVIVALVT